MVDHDGCVGCKYEYFTDTSGYCKCCKQNAVDKYRRMTNADKIKRMDIDELAEFLMKISCTNSPSCMMIDEDCKYFPDVPNDINGCKDCFKEWLESEEEL